MDGRAPVRAIDLGHGRLPGVRTERVEAAAIKEQDLIRLLKSGDEDAYRAFFDKYFTPLYNYVFYRCSRNHSMTEEIVADCLYNAVRAIPRLDEERSNLYIWLTTIARNKLTDYYRKQKPAVSLDDVIGHADQKMLNLFKDFSEDAPVNAEDMELEEVKTFVNAAMTALPHKYRESLRQKYMENKTIEEMADAHQMSGKAVESMLYRARLAFKETFEIMLKERMHPHID